MDNNKFEEEKKHEDMIIKIGAPTNILVPKQIINNEKRKNYTFTLTENERKLLTKISRRQGYNSDSKFLGELILSMENNI